MINILNSSSKQKLSGYTHENDLEIRQRKPIILWLLFAWMMIASRIILFVKGEAWKKEFWLAETILSEIDGGCIVFTDDDWETEFHWENVLEDDTSDGMVTFLDDWTVAGPLATMNFMASMYSGQRINLRKLYDEYIPGQERFWEFFANFVKSALCIAEDNNSCLIMRQWSL